MSPSRSTIRDQVFLTEPTFRLLYLLLFVATSAACGRGTIGGPGDWRSETVEVDGVRTVHTLGGSVWVGPARLVEEAVISPATAGEAGLFGQVEHMAVGNGCIYVVDSMGAVVRVFDLAGRYVRDIGRRGDGPGEFSRPRAVAVNPQDGRVFVRDGRGLRINVYAPDGSFLERWPMTSPVSTGSPIQIRSDGLVLTPQILGRFTAPGELQFGIVAFGPQGATGDTIPVPRHDYQDKCVTAVEEGGGFNASRIPFTPSVFWSFGPDGTIASGVGASYRIELRRPDGSILGIERQADPVSVQPAERSWWEACTTAGMR
jgi:hypothetical protein